jgi:hypothetical protein
MSFVRYLKREQYGSRPLLYGPYFTAQLIDIKEGTPVYTKGKDKYEITDRKPEYIYEPDQQTILPRAWNPEHKDAYERIIGLKEGQKPTFAQNMYFMFKHQIGTMYMRYFMWNFAGRESDEQGADWVGPNSWFEKVPAAIEQNRGRNNFFMIPFVLGLVGMFYQFVKDTKGFAVVGLIFILLGIAIVVYLNSPPEEPRERDYIYAGSTYAFCFWIGMSIIALADWLSKPLKKLKLAAVIATLIGLLAPGIMLAQGWDDHNRSDRFFSVDSAKNYLASCAPNAIIFTGGDNDTFPLWYAQEVEGFRTDVRVIVLSYFNTDWYIDQSMRKAYESDPFPYTLSINQYRQGGPNDYLRYTDLKIPAIDAQQYIGLLSKDYPQLRYENTNIVPSKVFSLKINKEEVLAKGFIPKNLESKVEDQMQFRMLRSGLEKKDLAILDLIVTNNWERPLYFNHTSLSQINLDLAPYAIQEGNAYRLIPVRNPNPEKDFVNTEVTFDNMINKFGYRGLDDPSIYYNEDYRGFVLNHRSALNSLAEALVDEYEAEKAGTTEVVNTEGPTENKLEKARKVIHFNLDKMPDAAVPYDHTTASTVELLFKVGEKDKAIEIANLLASRADEMLSYIIGKGYGVTLELRKNIFILSELQQIMYMNGEDELGKKYEDMYLKHRSDLQLE